MKHPIMKRKGMDWKKYLKNRHIEKRIRIYKT